MTRKTNRQSASAADSPTSSNARVVAHEQASLQAVDRLGQKNHLVAAQRAAKVLEAAVGGVGRLNVHSHGAETCIIIFVVCQ